MVVPIRKHAFFEQTQLQRLLGHNLLQIAGFTLQISHFAGRRLACCITSQSLLTLLSVTRTDGVPSAVHEILRPIVIQALRNPLTAAELRNRTLPTQTI